MKAAAILQMRQEPPAAPSGSLNTFAASDGIDRSVNIGGVLTPRLDFFMEANPGAVCVVRSLIECPDKFHCELAIDSWFNGADDAVYFGIMDSGAAISVNTTISSRPGEGTVAGCHIRISEGGTQVGVAANGASTVHNLGITAAVGDVLIMEGNRLTPEVRFYYWDASAGALVGGSPIVTKTLASLVPADWFVVAGGRRGNPGSPSTSDAGTANFGASPFVMTPTATYDGW